MAFILCRGCGKNISDRAPRCPHCGSPTQEVASALGDDSQPTQVSPEKQPQVGSPEQGPLVDVARGSNRNDREQAAQSSGASVVQQRKPGFQVGPKLGCAMFIFALWVFFAIRDLACSNKRPEPSRSSSRNAVTIKTDRPAFSGPVQLTVSATLNSGNQLAVEGQTNLPDDTKFLVSVRNKAIGFSAQDSVVVVNGRFSAGPFSSHGAALPTGNYSIDTVMTYPGLQPANVQAAIGAKGERLSGTYVTESSFGGKTVEHSQAVRIGSAAAVESSERMHSDTVNRVRKDVRALLAIGKSMEPYRIRIKRYDQAAGRACMDLMHKYQPMARTLHDEASAEGAFDLGVASTELIMCLSCLDDAMESCNRAQQSLDEEARDLGSR